MKGFIELTVKSADELSKMTAEELTAYKSTNEAAQKHNLEVSKAFQEKSDAKVSELETALKAQSEVIEKLNDTKKDSTASLIAAKNESIKKAITEIAQKGKSSFSLDTKAVTSASVIDGTDQYFYGIQGIGKQPVRMLVMESLFTSVNVGANSGGTIRYTDQNILDRQAGNVANCSLFPESNITWKTETDSIKKIADSIPVCKDAMEDFGFIESEVNNFILENLRLKLDQQLLLGTGTGLELNSVDSYAQTWSVGVGSPIEGMAASITSPTTYDVLASAICQIVNSGQANRAYYNPNAIVMNPTDVCQMKLEKDADGNYLLPLYFSADGMSIDGVPIYATPLVPQNTAYVFDSTKGIVYTERMIQIEMADEHGTDFLEDFVRIKGSTRKQLIVRSVNQDAFLKIEDIAAAKAALTKP
jgi:HK97 family phage major capsid protein